MSWIIECPNCGNKAEVTDYYTAKFLNCPGGCGKMKIIGTAD